MVSSAGRARKDHELSLHESEHRSFMLLARRALVELLRTRATATIDDLRPKIVIPASISCKSLGAIPTALARAGVIRRSGFTESTRPESHGRMLSAWSLSDREKATAWLLANPAPEPIVKPVVQRELFGGSHG